MAAVCEQLGIPVPQWQIVHNREELEAFAPHAGLPVLVRPTYVRGGPGMMGIRRVEELCTFCEVLGPRLSRHPVLIDQFLEGAVEIDVDAASDGREIYAIVMEQLEPAGVHSGDSTCVYPPQTLSEEIQGQIHDYTLRLASHLGIVGLLNVQYALKDGVVYLLEVNARASRTVPFASKATGVPLATIATRLIVGASLREVAGDYGLDGGRLSGQGQGQAKRRVSVKTVVFPFDKFPSLSRVLGPEMQSTGEAMGIGEDFASALAKARQGAGGSPRQALQSGD
jgi:carbamoyl-phosphate synthase large subunit